MLQHKKMNKLTHILILITITLILSSCSGGGDNNLPVSNKDIFKGTEGLKMIFLTNAPPEEVYEYKDFRVGISIRNAGAEHRTSGQLLIGYEQDYMELTGSNSKSINLEGRSLTNIYGDEDKYFFDFSSKKVDDMTTHHDSTIYATLCYDYKTEAAVDICIDTDIYNEKQSEKICRVEDKSLSSQGAPVAIKKVTQDIVPMGNNKVRPIFKIYVSNVGNGMVVKKSSLQSACSSNSLERMKDIGIIDFTAKIGDDMLKCEPAPLRLEYDEDFIRCELEDGIDTNFITYQSLLKIEMTYGYTFTISQNVDIKNYNDI